MKNRVKLTPENCPQHEMEKTFNGNIWIYRCKCGLWATTDIEGKPRASYSYQEDKPGKKISIDYTKGKW